MQITMNQEEIVEAVKAYVYRQIRVNEDQDITIDFKAGRGENGISATLDIVPAALGRPTNVGVATGISGPQVVNQAALSVAVDQVEPDDTQPEPESEPEAKKPALKDVLADVLAKAKEEGPTKAAEEEAPKEVEASSAKSIFSKAKG